MKTVVFDFNGTLLADSRLCWRTTNRMLQDLGKKTVTLAAYREAYSVPFDAMYKNFGCEPEELKTENIRDWFDRYKKESVSLRLRRGARPMLEQLRKEGCRNVILSNYVVENIKEQLDRLKILDLFDDVLANENHNTPMKTGKAARLGAYLDKNKINTGLIVGDTLEEIEIGRAHGLTTVAITDGVCSTQRLRAAGPDHLIHALHVVTKIVGGVVCAGATHG